MSSHRLACSAKVADGSPGENVEAAKTLRGIEGMDILETSAVVDGDQIKEYQTHVRIRFRIER